jgi:hypothetical protein
MDSWMARAAASSSTEPPWPSSIAWQPRRGNHVAVLRMRSVTRGRHFTCEDAKSRRRTAGRRNALSLQQSPERTAALINRLRVAANDRGAHRSASTHPLSTASRRILRPCLGTMSPDRIVARPSSAHCRSSTRLDCAEGRADPYHWYLGSSWGEWIAKHTPVLPQKGTSECRAVEPARARHLAPRTSVRTSYAPPFGTAADLREHVEVANRVYRYGTFVQALKFRWAYFSSRSFHARSVSSCSAHASGDGTSCAAIAACSPRLRS